MAQSIKLADDVMKLVRHESELQNRSAAGQVTHWLRIGRAIEQSGSFDHDQISAALSGAVETTELSTAEKEVWLDAFTERMAEPGYDEEEFFEGRQRLGLGVGLDGVGNLVHAKDKSAA